VQLELELALELDDVLALEALLELLVLLALLELAAVVEEDDEAVLLPASPPPQAASDRHRHRRSGGVVRCQDRRMAMDCLREAGRAVSQARRASLCRRVSTRGGADTRGLNCCGLMVW
jgi:hypothetical protein